MAGMGLEPKDIQLIGTEVAILWNDGKESYFPMEFLRAHSPNAENRGEPDIFGRIHGADPRKEFSGVTVTGWDYVGGYACRFEFSDGHRSGIYSYRFLRDLEKLLPESED